MSGRTSECRGRGAAKCSQRTQLTGRVVYADDPAYAAAKENLIKLYRSDPFAIVFAQSEGDVLNALRFARENRITPRIRCGGCSTQGYCGLDNAVTIDVSEMKKVEIDADRMVVRVGAGLTQAELTNALTDSGFFTATGNEGILGFIGVCLGGGIGLLSRIKGIGCYSLLEVRTVVTSGRCGAKLITANKECHPDLLWASRGGGGGNFGIVTGYTMRLYRQPRFITTWEVTFPFASFFVAYDAWQKWAPFADGRLSSNCTVLGSGVDIKGIFMGTAAELDDLLSPITGVPGATTTVTQVPFTTFYHLTTPPEEPFLKFSPMVAHRVFPLAALKIIRSFVAVAPSPKSNFFSLALGAAARKLPSGGAAFPFRKAIMYTECGAEWSDPDITPQALTWIEKFRLAMLPYFSGGYVNVLCAEISNYEEEYYGDSAERLGRVKARYDPHDVFHFEQSIKNRPPPLE